MEDLKEKTVDLADHVEDLATTFYQLTVVKLTKKATNLISGAIVIFTICLLGLFVLAFAGFALAWWLAEVFNSTAIGFLLTSGLFLLILFLIVVLRKATIFPFVRNIIVRKLYD